VNFAYQICVGMAKANDTHQIVHGGLKPENILVSKDGIVKITDFGLAKRFSILDEFPRIAAGSLPYMSPEQLRGEVVDTRSDIFSFGIILYEMFTGKLPYTFDTHALRGDATLWREKLEEFYSGKDFYSDRWNTNLWNSHPLIQEKDLDVFVGNCLFPYSGHRWQGFKNLANQIELEYGNILTAHNMDLTHGMNQQQKAFALMNIGKFDDALGVFNKILIENPENPDLRLGAAEALAHLGMTDSARNFINTARHLKPNIVIESNILSKILSRR